MERTALAKDINLEKDDTVLEIGCGRGYFTIAAAQSAKRVIGLDQMDGFNRNGWWRNFREAVTELELKSKVSSLKADAQTIPLRDCAVNKVVAVHSIRNFQNRKTIRNSLLEMNRVLSADGEMIIAENIPVARNRLQEAHLAIYNCKCRYDLGDLFYFSQEELLEMFREAGLTKVQIKIADYNMSATPPIFYLNPSILKKKQLEKAQKEYGNAVEKIKRYGKASPPVAIVKANKHS